MNSLSWARFGLFWSACWLVFSVAHAVTANSQDLALIHGTCALAHLALCAWSMKAARLSRRLLAAVASIRRRDRAYLLASAWLGVWTDRVAVHGWRHPRTDAAHLGAVRALACYEVAVALQ